MATGTRGGNGRYIRTADSRKRDQEAAALRTRGYSFQRIADQLGYASKCKAHDAVNRAYTEIPGEAAEEAKRLDLERIDHLIERAWDIMVGTYATVSQGKVFDDVPDHGPAALAIREIRALLERRAKMIGYDAPAKSRIEVITEDTIEDEIRKLEAQIGQARDDKLAE